MDGLRPSFRGEESFLILGIFAELLATKDSITGTSVYLKFNTRETFSRNPRHSIAEFSLGTFFKRLLFNGELGSVSFGFLKCPVYSPIKVSEHTLPIDFYFLYLLSLF